MHALTESGCWPVPPTRFPVSIWGVVSVVSPALIDEDAPSRGQPALVSSRRRLKVLRWLWRVEMWLRWTVMSMGGGVVADTDVEGALAEVGRRMDVRTSFPAYASGDGCRRKAGRGGGLGESRGWRMVLVGSRWDDDTNPCRFGAEYLCNSFSYTFAGRDLLLLRISVSCPLAPLLLLPFAGIEDGIRTG
ncbi:hypothetical protein R3P38DRAFT_2813611 [Favolaschia claudopus]|uniref:Uncharacterized protein n=1 Tax=Favolaschia claudopus TaxID=2862362 RepID=A0AAV9Z518_9AGAR